MMITKCVCESAHLKAALSFFNTAVSESFWRFIDLPQGERHPCQWHSAPGIGLYWITLVSCQHPLMRTRLSSPLVSYSLLLLLIFPNTIFFGLFGLWILRPASFLWPAKRCWCRSVKCCRKAKPILVRGRWASNQRCTVLWQASRGHCVNGRGAIYINIFITIFFKQWHTTAILKVCPDLDQTFSSRSDPTAGRAKSFILINKDLRSNRWNLDSRPQPLVPRFWQPSDGRLPFFPLESSVF